MDTGVIMKGYMNIERRYRKREQFYGVLKMAHYSQDYKVCEHETLIAFQM
jgi:hypothetical protein